ncbi:hypothetical protein ACQ5SP_13370 [Rhodovulum sp. YNF3179]|uniref:hypothetical protein n=1 Tax=Rhodovulum sp. YNF3179 TaxID=3425127 RepID=UPI003D3446F8
MPGPTERPALTFPEEVAGWVRSHYMAASVILEYGSGGSTVLASELPGRTIFSVESDARWADGVEAYIAASERTRSSVALHRVDLGATGRWGRPKRPARWKDYWRYPVSVWEREDFRQPDLVLVDGLFRMACTLMTLVMTQRPVVLLFDDFMNPRDELRTVRPRHAGVLDFLEPVATRGCMAKFTIEPMGLPRQQLGRFLATFFKSY